MCPGGECLSFTNVTVVDFCSENIQGSLHYIHDLKIIDKGGAMLRWDSRDPLLGNYLTQRWCRRSKIQEILQASNYSDFGKPPLLFDPDNFDERSAHERLTSSLGVPVTVQSGTSFYICPQVDSMTNGFLPSHDRPDPRPSLDNRCCVLCGKPPSATWSFCSRCREVR